LIPTETQQQVMQCHYCDREAAYAAESDAVRVGLCEEHFRERVEELAESEGLERVRDEVDVRQPDHE
jgi:hypothetical protein